MLRTLCLLACVLALVPACIYVRVRGDLGQEVALLELVHEAAPAAASFRAGPAQLRARAILGRESERVTLRFACERAELEAFFAAVGARVRAHVERHGVTSWRDARRPRERVFEFSGDEGAGRARVSYRRLEDGDWPYELVIELERD